MENKQNTKQMDKIKRKLIIKKYSIDFLYIIVGCFIMAVGTSMFLLPNQLSSGGFAGISTILYLFSLSFLKNHGLQLISPHMFLIFLFQICLV